MKNDKFYGPSQICPFTTTLVGGFGYLFNSLEQAQAQLVRGSVSVMCHDKILMNNNASCLVSMTKRGDFWCIIKFLNSRENLSLWVGGGVNSNIQSTAPSLSSGISFTRR